MRDLIDRSLNSPPIFGLAKASADSAAAPTEIDLGEQDVTITVDVRWAIK